MSLKQRILSLPYRTQIIGAIFLGFFVIPILSGIMFSIIVPDNPTFDNSTQDLNFESRSTVLTNKEILGTYEGSNKLRSTTYAVKIELRGDGTYTLHSYISTPGLETRENITKGKYEMMVEKMEDRNEYNEVTKTYYAHAVNFIDSEFPGYNRFYRVSNNLHNVNNDLSLFPLTDLMDPGKSILHRQ